MSEASRSSDTAAEQNTIGPDCFGYYTNEIIDLLAQTEDLLPITSQSSVLDGRTYGIKEGDSSEAGSLFCNAVGAGISDFKKEKLKALLRQSVVSLTQEVDEMVDPIFALRRIQRYKMKMLSSLSATSECDGEHSRKKIKQSSPSASMRSDSPSSCSRNGEVNDDLQLLLKTDGSKVEETMKKVSDELSETLGCKKQKLEELLDIVMSNCRLMTLDEKQQLQNLIQKLPPRNLNRVVEIIKRRKPLAKPSPDKIFVNLEKLDNTTLWRLYYHVKAVENARKLSVVSHSNLQEEEANRAEQLSYGLSKSTKLKVSFSQNHLCLEMGKKSDAFGEKKEHIKWTPSMDQLFIETMLKEQNQGIRPDGRFTTGAYNSMVKFLREKLDLPDLNKGHLKNRMKTLKKNFAECYDLFNTKNSYGFAWNPITKMFNAEESVWKTLIEAKPVASKWTTKQIHNYDALKKLFAKDRATVDGAEMAKEKRK